MIPASSVREGAWFQLVWWEKGRGFSWFGDRRGVVSVGVVGEGAWFQFA